MNDERSSPLLYLGIAVLACMAAGVYLVMQAAKPAKPEPAVAGSGQKTQTTMTAPAKTEAAATPKSEASTTEAAKSEAPPPAVQAPHAESGEKSAATFEEMVNQRKELDQTVWKTEVQAQHYESAFIQLWDDLRASKDPFETLAQFPFSTLKVAGIGKPNSFDAGISAFETLAGEGDVRTLDPKAWRAELEAWKTKRYRILETEWHHATFDPAGETAPARSTVSYLLHVVGPDNKARFVVKGKLKIEWSKQTDAHGNFAAGAIDATDMTVLYCPGGAVFETVEAVKGDFPHGGLLVCDLDGDGLSEIALPAANALYRNKGNFTFEKEALLPKDHNIQHGIFADFDGDGTADFIGAGKDTALLFQKGGQDGRFTGEAAVIGAVKVPLQQPYTFTAGDIDGDGDLDLFLAQYKVPYRGGQAPTPYYDANDGYPAYLLRNDGGGQWTDITEAAGVGAKRFRRTYSSSLADLDGDGDLDLLVVSDYSGIDVYLNDGKGTFEDATSKWIDETANFGMSHCFADFNLDGRLDFYVCGMASTTARRLTYMKLERPDVDSEMREARMRMAYGNRMYLGHPGGGFQQPKFKDEVARSGWSWGCTAFDFDHDGDADIYIGNGFISGTTARDYCTRFWCHDVYTPGSKATPELASLFKFEMDKPLREGMSWNGFEHNNLYVNQKGAHFLNGGFLLGAGLETDTRSVVSDDLDGDGREDLVMIVLPRAVIGPNASTGALHIYRNTLDSGRHWVGVRLRGAAGRSPIGAKITVTAGGKTQFGYIVTGDSMTSQHATAKVFGLDRADTIDVVEVRWPGGAVQKVPAPKTDRWYTVAPEPQKGE